MEQPSRGVLGEYSAEWRHLIEQYGELNALAALGLEVRAQPHSEPGKSKTNRIYRVYRYHPRHLGLRTLRAGTLLIGLRANKAPVWRKCGG